MSNKATEVSKVTQVQRAVSYVAEKEFNKQLPVSVYTVGGIGQTGMEAL